MRQARMAVMGWFALLMGCAAVWAQAQGDRRRPAGDRDSVAAGARSARDNSGSDNAGRGRTGRNDPSPHFEQEGGRF
jgi:hypothetical protein